MKYLVKGFKEGAVEYLTTPDNKGWDQVMCDLYQSRIDLLTFPCVMVQENPKGALLDQFNNQWSLSQFICSPLPEEITSAEIDQLYLQLSTVNAYLSELLETRDTDANTAVELLLISGTIENLLGDVSMVKVKMDMNNSTDTIS